MVFLKESATEGWWAAPENVNQLISHADWSLNANGTYLVNYPRGIGFRLSFRSILRQKLLTCVNDFAQNSSSPSQACESATS